MQQEGIQALQVLRRAGFSISLFLMVQRNACVKQYHEVTSLQAYVFAALGVLVDGGC